MGVAAHTVTSDVNLTQPEPEESNQPTNQDTENLDLNLDGTAAPVNGATMTYERRDTQSLETDNNGEAVLKSPPAQKRTTKENSPTSVASGADDGPSLSTFADIFAKEMEKARNELREAEEKRRSKECNTLVAIIVVMLFFLVPIALLFDPNIRENMKTFMGLLNWSWVVAASFFSILGCFGIQQINAVRTEMNHLRTEMNHQFDEVKTRLNHQFDEVKTMLANNRREHDLLSHILPRSDYGTTGAVG